ncbi:hypothetical protein SARC_12170, partial [Sphaeroforma arctica JP610]
RYTGGFAPIRLYEDVTFVDRTEWFERESVKTYLGDKRCSLQLEESVEHTDR